MAHQHNQTSPQKSPQENSTSKLNCTNQNNCNEKVIKKLPIDVKLPWSTISTITSIDTLIELNTHGFSSYSTSTILIVAMKEGRKRDITRKMLSFEGWLRLPIH